MEKETGKEALGKRVTPLFGKTFILFSYLMVIDVPETSGFLGFCQKYLKNLFPFRIL